MAASFLTAVGLFPDIRRGREWDAHYHRLLAHRVAEIPLERTTKYHVAATGNDTTGTGSIIAPWLTFGKAVTAVEAGSGDAAILLRQGDEFRAAAGQDITKNNVTVVAYSPHAFLTGANLQLPGVAGNYASTPDSAALSITGDLDLRCKVALADWTPAALNMLIAKESSTTTRSYKFYVTTGGAIQLTLSADGSAVVNATNSGALGLTDGSTKWLRTTWRQSDGQVQYFTSDDGATWTQVGSNQTIAIASIHDNVSPLEIGSRVAGSTEVFAGYIYSAEVRSGIDGTIVASPNFAAQRRGTRTFTDSAWNTWTVKDSATAGAALPILTLFSVNLPSLLWTLDTGTTYYISESVSVGQFRQNEGHAARMNPISRQTSLANCRATVRSWFWDSGTGRLYLNWGGDPAGVVFDVAYANTDDVLRTSGDGVRVQGIRFEGGGLVAPGTTPTIGMGLRCEGDSLVIGCECFYSGYHAMGMIASVAGKVQTYINCRAGLQVDDGVEDALFIGYDGAGDHEVIYHNCVCTHGYIPNGTVAWVPKGTSFYGHTSTGTVRLFVVYNCESQDGPYAAKVSARCDNLPVATTPDAARGFIIGEKHTLTTSNAVSSAIWLGLYNVHDRCQYRIKHTGTGAGQLETQVNGQYGWTYNSFVQFEVTSTAVTEFYFLSNNGFGSNVNCDIDHCHLHMITPQGSTATFGVEYADGGAMVERLRNSIVSSNRAHANIALRMSNNAARVVNNAYFQISNRTHATRGYHNDPGGVELPYEPIPLARPTEASPLYRTGSTAPGLSHDLYGDHRYPVDADIGPVGLYAVPAEQHEGQGVLHVGVSPA